MKGVIPEKCRSETLTPNKKKGSHNGYTHLDDNRIMKYVESTVKQRLTRRLMQSKQAAIMDKYEQENARLQAKIEELEAAELNTTEVEQFMTESNGSLPVGLDVEKNN